MPHELGWPEQDGPLAEVEPPATLEANVENFFSRRDDPHSGHLVSDQSLERTSNSESASQA